MQITQLDALTYVGPQISIANLGNLRRFKIDTIIVARPEDETDDQPAISALREAADALGIMVHQIPVVPGNITNNDVLAYAAIVSKTDRPVFAYCRSGMRATSLWALNVAQQGQAHEEILQTANSAGFDLTSVAARLVTNAP